MLHRLSAQATGNAPFDAAKKIAGTQRAGWSKAFPQIICVLCRMCTVLYRHHQRGIALVPSSATTSDAGRMLLRVYRCVDEDTEELELGQERLNHHAPTALVTRQRVSLRVGDSQ